MKILLLKPVKGYGEAGKIIEVKDGYATNFLIPQRLGTTDLEAKVSKSNLKLSKEKLQAVVNKLKKAHVSINKQSNEDGTLFASVAPQEVRDLLQSIYPELMMAKLDVVIPSHIKSTGEHAVRLNISGTQVPMKISVTDPAKNK